MALTGMLSFPSCLNDYNTLHNNNWMLTFCMVFLTGGNATSTYYRIKKLIKRSVHHANRIYALTEFYGRGQNIYRGIKFKLTNYHIDTGEDCEPRPK